MLHKGTLLAMECGKTYQLKVEEKSGTRLLILKPKEAIIYLSTQNGGKEERKRLGTRKVYDISEKGPRGREESYSSMFMFFDGASQHTFEFSGNCLAGACDGIRPSSIYYHQATLYEVTSKRGLLSGMGATIEGGLQLREVVAEPLQELNDF